MKSLIWVCTVCQDLSEYKDHCEIEFFCFFDFQEQIYGLFEVNQQLEKEKSEKEQRLARLRHANNTDRLTEIQVGIVQTNKNLRHFFGQYIIRV